MSKIYHFLSFSCFRQFRALVINLLFSLFVKFPPEAGKRVLFVIRCCFFREFGHFRVFRVLHLRIEICEDGRYKIKLIGVWAGMAFANVPAQGGWSS